MASIINASSTGSGGIVQTADASGILQLQANGTVALTVNSNASLTASNTGSGMTFASSAGSGIRVYGAAGTNQWDIYGNGANLRFSDNTGGGRIVIDGTASVGTTFGVGGATPAASGAGVTFPATQSASSNANTLDDYEEGTWTPAITFGGGSTGQGYLTQSGRYTKIGNIVEVEATITFNNKGSSTGQAVIANLPFNATGSPYGLGNVAFDQGATNLPTNAGYYYGIAATSVAYLRYNPTSGNYSAIDNTQFGNSTSVYFCCVYKAD
jgi:hypothetical protein